MTTPSVRHTTRGPYRIAYFMEKHGLSKEEAVAILNRFLDRNWADHAAVAYIRAKGAAATNRTGLHFGGAS